MCDVDEGNHASQRIRIRRAARRRQSGAGQGNTSVSTLFHALTLKQGNGGDDTTAANNGDPTSPAATGVPIPSTPAPSAEQNSGDKSAPTTDSTAGAQPQQRAEVDDDMTGAPAWIQEAKTFLDSVSRDERWASVIREWMCLEDVLGYPGAQVSVFTSD